MADREATRIAALHRRFLLPSALTVRRKVLEWIMPIPEEMVFIADVPLQAAALVMGTLILDQPLFTTDTTRKTSIPSIRRMTPSSAVSTR